MKISELLKKKKNAEFEIENEKKRIKDKITDLGKAIGRIESDKHIWNNKIANIPVNKDAKTRFFLALDKFVEQQTVKLIATRFPKLHQGMPSPVELNPPSFQSLLNIYNLNGVFDCLIENMPDAEKQPDFSELPKLQKKKQKLIEELNTLN